VKDKIVPYSQISIGRIFFGGTMPLAKAYKKHGYNYNACRYVNHGHEIANNMVLGFPEEIRFLETNVIRGQKRIIDTFVDNPDIPFPDRGLIQYKSIYKSRRKKKIRIFLLFSCSNSSSGTFIEYINIVCDKLVFMNPVFSTFLDLCLS
jgi:hypothetical protein